LSWLFSFSTDKDRQSTSGGCLFANNFGRGFFQGRNSQA
jgi:hypothetical protein